ncbi:MAG: DNA-binding protein [Nakamurella sp.]
MRNEAVIREQLALYGEPLSARFQRLLTAYGIPQSRLATVIGLSAPMLSQLMNAQRVKISNSDVFARMVRLEEIAADRAGDRAALAAGLADVVGSHPVLSTQQSAHTAGGRGASVTYLAGFAPPALRAAAGAAAEHGDAALAAVLSSAAEQALRSPHSDPPADAER